MADSNILRIGKISSINYPEGTARISYEDKSSSTTSELPFLAWEYWMPKVGDQVLVGHLSNGSCAGVIIGPVWHGDYQPADGREGVYRKEYSNEQGVANETYDAGAKAYNQTIDGSAEVDATESWTVQVGGCTIQANKDGTMTIVASSNITINAPEVKIMGKIEVEKEAKLKDTLLVEKQVTVNKGVTATEDVKAGSISLQNHKHTAQGPTSPTSPAIP